MLICKGVKPWYPPTDPGASTTPPGVARGARTQKVAVDAVGCIPARLGDPVSAVRRAVRAAGAAKFVSSDLTSFGIIRLLGSRQPSNPERSTLLESMQVDELAGLQPTGRGLAALQFAGALRSTKANFRRGPLSLALSSW